MECLLALWRPKKNSLKTLFSVYTQCNTPQQTATHRSTLQHTAIQTVISEGSKDFLLLWPWHTSYKILTDVPVRRVVELIFPHTCLLQWIRFIQLNCSMSSAPPSRSRSFLDAGFRPRIHSFVWFYTISSELTYFLIFTYLSEPGLISVGFQWGHKTLVARSQVFKDSREEKLDEYGDFLQTWTTLW